MAVYEEISTGWDEYKAYMQEVINYNKAGQDDQAKKVILTDSNELGDKLRNEFDNLVERNTTEARERSENNDQLASNAIVTMIIVIFIGVLIAVILGILNRSNHQQTNYSDG
jgi:methyl-accepting chemotaxis protein